MDSCSKFRHDSREHAEKAATKLRDRDLRRHGKSSVRIYECPKCAGYHLTSKGGT